nr:hypothetical protein [Tanacetum cinerariifolium]
QWRLRDSGMWWCRRRWQQGGDGSGGGAWGEWCGGSNRSGDGESFWVRQKKPAKKVFWWRREVVAVVAGRRWAAGGGGVGEKGEEVKNVVEQPAKHGYRIIESLQNFRVIRKSSTSLKDTSQISPVHVIASILSTKEPEYSPSMGYEHLSTTPEMELDEVTECSAKNLLPIPSECKVTSEDESKCDVPIQDQSSSEDIPIEESKVYSNPLFDNDEINYDELESHVESNFVESLSNHDALIESFDFKEEIHLIENLLYDNSSPRPPEELNAEIANTIVESIPSSLILVHDNDSQREEIDIVTERDDVLPLSVENDDDSEEDIHFLKELLSDNSIPLTKDESSDFDHQDDPSFPRPPPEPPDAEFDFKPDYGEEIKVVMNDNDELECLDPSDENNEDDDYFLFMFVIRIFLPYLICSKMFLSFLSAESEDIIFDPGFTPH